MRVLSRVDPQAGTLACGAWWRTCRRCCDNSFSYRARSVSRMHETVAVSQPGRPDSPRFQRRRQEINVEPFNSGGSGQCKLAHTARSNSASATLMI